MRQTVIFLALLAMPFVAVGHGSDKPGPHGGSVRMPGAFHVEVVHDGEALQVYLLDVQIANPTVADSSITVTVKQDGNTTELDCEADRDRNRFSCPTPATVDLDAGTLGIDAKRGEMPVATAHYELPLSES